MSDASKIETNGVNPVPDNERYGRPFDLFPVWFSWNISIFGITLGIYVFGLGLSVWQAMLAGVIGYFLSCALVGILAVGSVRTGLPTLVQSRLAFGYHGNKLPTFFGYLANMGWKVTLLSMATTTLADLVANLVPGLLNDKGMPVAGCTLGCFAVVLLLTMSGAIYGHQLIIKIEKAIAWLTGIFTIVYLFFFIPNINFSALSSAPSGSFATFVGGIVLSMTMVGLGFLNYGGDYARYLPRKTPARGVIFWTTTGIAVPVSVLLILGVMLAVGNPALLEKANHEPLAALTGILPFWFYVPFSLIVIISLISAGMTGILSNVSYRSLPTLENGYQSGAAEKSDNKLSTPIHVYFNYKPTERLAVGLGFYTPYGSSMNWGDNWSGAHLVQEINLTAFTFQPTVSYKICDRLSVGAGLTVSWGNFDLSRSLLSPTMRRGLISGTIDPGIAKAQAGIAQLESVIAALPDGAQKEAYQQQLQQTQGTLQTLEGAKGYLNSTMNRSLVSAKLQGDSDVAVGVNAGFLWDITDEWSVGMTWRSRLNMKVGKGHATMNIDPQAAALIAKLGELKPDTELIPGLDKGTFNAELPLPTTVTWAVSFRPAVKWELAVDLQWTGWSAYKALNVAFNEKELGIKPIYSVKNYSNTLAFRFGAQYRATDFITARMGMYVDESPVSSDYLNPETPSMTKVSYTAGLSLRPTKFMSIDLAYCYVSSADPERTGSYPLYGYTDGNLEEGFSGNYTLHANVFSIGVGFSF